MKTGAKFRLFDLTTALKWGGRLISIGTAILLAWSHGAASAAEIFGSREVASQDLAAFQKWTGMLTRLQPSAGRATPTSGNCLPNFRFLCWTAEEEALIANLQTATAAEKLDGVNRFINRAPYVEDIHNWGVGDYWSTPEEFYRRAGDCEDFAIAKYMILKKLGFDPGLMRIVVLDDLNLGVHHAVLAVDLDGTNMILDNQLSVVAPDSAIVHYRPIYSINETGWWLHVNEDGQPLYTALQN